MMKVTITSNGKSKTVSAGRGQSLIEILRQNHYEIYAPCGGKGTCGKCLVEVKGDGPVLSCNYYPVKNVEIILPDTKEANILTSQTEYLYDLPLDEESTIRLSPHSYGVAVDLGTTTVVMYFLDLRSGKIEKIASFINPQSAFGADVITRITHCQLNATGLQDLHQAIISALNREMRKFAACRNISTASFEKLTFAGNTTMMHLLLGEDPVSIALSPFKPRFTATRKLRGDTTGLSVNKEAIVVTMPSVAAFVGADIIAGLAALNVNQKNYLFLDVGTNGEIALVTGDEIFTCAAAAGPAFEGANLTCGMSARTGAISSFTGPGEYLVIGNSEPVGICGSGIVDIVAFLVANGIVDETGYMKDHYVVNHDNNIYVTQKDIREIQLAKSAIYSGMKILIKMRGLTFSDIDALFLAGGFGNYINIRSALQIGLLPEELTGKIYPVGNSAGIGALQYLKSNEFVKRTDMIKNKARYVELSNDDDFTTEFALNMSFTR